MASVITIAGEQLFAAKAQANEQLDIDTFIFANVPNQDPTATINREEGIPTAYKVHEQAVQQIGRINDNVVVYSTVMDSITGPFDFNWVGLYSSVNQKLVAVNHVPTVTKTVTEPGAAGNTLNRNFGIEYSGIAELTGITVEPETWQLDFTARLSGMDLLTKQLAADMNGKNWFIDDGFKVVQRGTVNTFSITPGIGYVSGLRVELKQEHILTLQTYPQFVYVDAWFSGNANSTWTPQIAFTVTNGEMDDYIDPSGALHHVYKLAVINAVDSVDDLRPESANKILIGNEISNRTTLGFVSIENMVDGVLIGGSQYLYHGGEYCSVGESKWKVISISNPMTINDFKAIGIFSTADDNGKSYESCGWSQLEPESLTEIKKRTAAFTDEQHSTYSHSIKAWASPKGIKDTAAAGSFILSSNGNEPETQVTGFADFDSIGQYPGRDAVALYSQVDSAPATLKTSNVIYTNNTITSPDIIDIFDSIKLGMIADVNFGNQLIWVGAVIIGKIFPDTLLVSSWRKIDGSSIEAEAPTGTLEINRHNNIWAANFNALTSNEGGANQAIGIETGLSCAGLGTGTNSKAYYAVNLGGEDPEYAFTLNGSFQKGYTSKDTSVYGFQSTNDIEAFRAKDSRGNSFYSENPIGNHIECRSDTGSEQFLVKNDGKLCLGANAESGGARINIRGSGGFSDVYDRTELQIYDPTTTLEDRQGFFIMQNFPASVSLGTFTMGVGHSGSHEYELAISVAGGNKLFFTKNGAVEPGTNNTQKFGGLNKLWNEIYCGNNVINISDERLKTFRETFSDKEKSVAVKLGQLLTSYFWNESVEREQSGGSKARIHIGIGAQSLAKAFKDEGLDPSDYAMFCYESWDEKITQVQTNIGQKVCVEYFEEKPVTEIIEVIEEKEKIELIDGKYTLVKSKEKINKEIQVYDIHHLHDDEGNIIYDRKVIDGSISSFPKEVTIPRVEKVKVEREVDAEPEYEDVITPAGDRFGVRLEQVVAFILANILK
jgi:hypothetical protein